MSRLGAWHPPSYLVTPSWESTELAQNRYPQTTIGYINFDWIEQIPCCYYFNT